MVVVQSLYTALLYLALMAPTTLSTTQQVVVVVAQSPHLTPLGLPSMESASLSKTQQALVELFRQQILKMHWHSMELFTSLTMDTMGEKWAHRM